MTPILKDKQRRDTVLLVAMLAMTLVFLVYLFYPGAAPGPPPPADGPRKLSLQSASEEPSGRYVAELTRLLEQAFQVYASRSTDLEADPVALLARHLDGVDALGRTGAGRRDLRVWRQHAREVGLFELGDPRILKLPAFVSPRTGFRLYLALFLLRLQDPAETVRLREASEQRLLHILSAPIFQTVDWEIHTNAAAVPALAVFDLWLKRTEVYPDTPPGVDLARALDHFRDLSPGRWIIRMHRWIDFSAEVRIFALEWREDDGFFGTDRKTYADLPLPVYRFLGQVYSRLPRRRGSPGAWMRDLADSDSGDIELLSLRLLSLEASRPELAARWIWYNPLGDRFTLVFSREEPPSLNGKDLLERWIRDRRNTYHRAYREVHLGGEEPAAPSKASREELRRFGNFLKRLVTGQS